MNVFHVLSPSSPAWPSVSSTVSVCDLPGAPRDTRGADALCTPDPACPGPHIIAARRGARPRGGRYAKLALAWSALIIIRLGGGGGAGLLLSAVQVWERLDRLWAATVTL